MRTRGGANEQRSRPFLRDSAAGWEHIKLFFSSFLEREKYSHNTLLLAFCPTPRYGGRKVTFCVMDYGLQACQCVMCVSFNTHHTHTEALITVQRRTLLIEKRSWIVIDRLIPIVKPIGT
jgi:hypothetical protein